MERLFTITVRALYASLDQHVVVTAGAKLLHRLGRGRDTRLAIADFGRNADLHVVWTP
jgi:hypothetical protein